MKKIILTGGGTAGHVTPNLALLPALREEDFEIHYIGSYNGIERRLIEAASIPYDGISSGKLRRYFDLKNFSDPLRVLKGYFEARKLMKKLGERINNAETQRNKTAQNRSGNGQKPHRSSDRQHDM